MTESDTRSPILTFNMGNPPSLQILTLHHFFRKFHPNIPIQYVNFHASMDYLTIDSCYIAGIKDFAFYINELETWMQHPTPWILEYLDGDCVTFKSNHGKLGWKKWVNKMFNLNLEVLPKRLDQEIIFPELRSNHKNNANHINHDNNNSINGIHNANNNSIHNFNQKASKYELYYSDKQVHVTSTFELELVLNSLQQSLQDAKKFGTNHPIHQLVQSQIYIYVSNLVPKNILDKFSLLKQFIVDSYVASAPFDVDTSIQDEQILENVSESDAYFTKSIERYWQKDIYSENNNDDFIRIIKKSKDQSEYLILSRDTIYSMSRSAKIFLQFSFLSCSAYFFIYFAIPRYYKYLEQRYPKESNLVFIIPNN